MNNYLIWLLIIFYVCQFLYILFSEILHWEHIALRVGVCLGLLNSLSLFMFPSLLLCRSLCLPLSISPFILPLSLSIFSSRSLSRLWLSTRCTTLRKLIHNFLLSSSSHASFTLCLLFSTLSLSLSLIQLPVSLVVFCYCCLLLLPLYFGGKTCFDQNASKKLCDKIKEIFAAHFVTFFHCRCCCCCSSVRSECKTARKRERGT